MDNLPIELRSEIGKYLTSGDLKVMRLLDSSWNHVARDSLQSRRRDPMTLTFDDVKRVAHFNDTFANYRPMGELALAKFSFLLPVLASDEATAHLDTFGQTFGQSVTSLSLHFQGDTRTASFENGQNISEEGMNAYWFMSRERDAIDRNVTSLLAKVKGQLQTLELKNYFGMSPCLLGTDPFPALSTLKVDNVRDGFGHQFGEEAEDRWALGRVAAIQEACVLELSRKVPAIQEFDFGYYDFGPSDDPAYLATVLRNLDRYNPEVRCKLKLRLPSIASRRSLKFVQKLTGVDVHLCELYLGVPGEGANREDFRLLLEYVGRQSDHLRKLTLDDSRRRIVLTSTLSPVAVRLPHMRVLEDLELNNVSPVGTDAPDHFPSLRHLKTEYSGNDLAMTFPGVTDLTLVNFRTALEAQSAAEDFRRFISNFPNLWSLNCSIEFFALPAIFTKAKLTHLKIGDMGHKLWDIVTEKRSPRLTFDEIVDLDVTPGAVAEAPSFKDLTSLREVILTVCFPMEQELNAVLYISKIGKLKRLHRLAFKVSVFWTADRSCSEIATKYLLELRKHHNIVEII